MAIYVVVLIFAMLLGVFMHPNSSQKRKRNYIIITFGLIVLISALRKYTVGNDLAAHYYNTFLRIADLDWTYAIASTSYETGFVALYKIVAFFTVNPQWMIAIHSIIVIGISGWFIYRNSEDVVMSTFLFIACNTWFMYLTMLRQSLAIAISLVAIEIFKNKNLKIRRYIIYIALIILASTMHSSAIILLILPIFEHLKFERKEIFMSIAVAFIAFVSYSQLFSFVSGIISSAKDYEDAYGSTGAVVNIISIYELFVPLLCFAIGCYTIAVRKSNLNNSECYIQDKNELTEKKELANSMLLYILLMFVICRLLRMQIYIVSRLAQYFVPYMWILYPRAINRDPLVTNQKIMRAFIYLIYTIAFVWIAYQSAAGLWGTVPYEFFWN